MRVWVRTAKGSELQCALALSMHGKIGGEQRSQSAPRYQ